MPDFGDDWGEEWGGTPAPITDHKNAALARLISTFKKPNIEKLICVPGDRAQTIENVVSNIASLFDIDGATAYYQDIIGSILNEPRNSNTHAVYRVFLKTKAQIVKRRNTVEDLLSMMRRLVNDDLRNITYTDTFPKGFKLEVDNLTQAEIAAFIPFVKLAKPATYVGKFIVVPVDAFGFSDQSLTIPITNFGFGDGSGTIPGLGGPFAYLVPF